MSARPSVVEERSVELEATAGAWKYARILDATAFEALRKHAATRWSVASLIARLGMFVLGLILVGALFGFFSIVELPGEGFVTGAFAIGVAELLIRKGRLFRSGIEEALWIGGAFAIVFGLPGPARIEGLLLFAAASAVAGVRLLNPLFAIVGLAFAVIYAGEKTDLDVLVGWIAIVLGVVAVAFAPRRFARPMVDQCTSLVVLASVPVAYSAFLVAPGVGMWMPGDLAATELAAIVALGAYALVTGIRRRLHPPLIAGLAAIAALGIELRDLFPIADEAKLVIAGAILFATALLLERRLRDREAGLTARRLTASSFEPLPEILGGAIVAPGPAMPEPSRGGQFGGGGASGEY